MRLTVPGGCGGWPAAGLACSGYLGEATYPWHVTGDPARYLSSARQAGAVPGLVAEPDPRGE